MSSRKKKQKPNSVFTWTMCVAMSAAQTTAQNALV